MTTQLQNPVTLEGLIKRSAFSDRFKEVLGERAPQFMSSLLAVGKTLPDVEPRSIIAAAMNAAVLNLPIDKNLGFAWIIAYRKGNVKLAQFQLGYKGFIQLALRSGCYAGMNAAGINKEVFAGWSDMGFAKLDWSKFDPEKPVVGYAFAFALANTPNCVWTFYWTKERVKAHAERYSQSYRKKSEDSPWTTNFDRQAIKTVVKNELAHWGILSIDFQTALLKDQSVAIDVDSDVEYPDNDLLLGEGEGEPQKSTESLPIGSEPKKETPKKESPKKEPELKPTPEPVNKGPEPPSPVPDAQQLTLTPQQKLAAFVIDQGYNFTIFAKWGIESGNLEDADSLPGFDAVPTKLAERFLGAQKGLIDGLKRAVLL